MRKDYHLKMLLEGQQINLKMKIKTSIILVMLSSLVVQYVFANESMDILEQKWFHYGANNNDIIDLILRNKCESWISKI